MFSLLHLSKTTARFGGLTAVSELDLEIGSQELVGLIGPNGAGKTTVFNLITGVYQPSAGSISFNGSPTAGQKPFQLAKRGIARTFQNIRLFASMSVFDNVRAAMRLHCPSGLRNALWRGRSFRQDESRIAGEVMELLALFHLESLRHEPAAHLPYGARRRLEIVRALATRPRLLLLDEPAAGMNPTEKAELTGLIRSIREKFRIAILLVEHDMPLVMKICERIAVLDHGVKIAEGTPTQIQSDEKVIAAYLGV